MARDPELYHKLSASIAPSIYGDYTANIKKAIACLLVGGSRKRLPDGMIVSVVLLSIGPMVCKITHHACACSFVVILMCSCWVIHRLPRVSFSSSWRKWRLWVSTRRAKAVVLQVSLHP